MLAAMPSSEIHDLKILPEFFDQVLHGIKRAEIRRTDDRTFVAGEQIRLWEWDGKKKKYTGQCMLVEILHVQALEPIFAVYKMDAPKVPLAVLSFGARKIVNGQTPPAA